MVANQEPKEAAADAGPPAILLVGLGSVDSQPTGEALAGARYRVRTLDEPAAALALLAGERRPALVILDAARVDDRLLSLCAAAHGAAGEPPIPVIVVLASATTPEKVAVIDAGADDALVRPVEAAEMLARVHSLLRSKAAYDQMAAEIQRQTQIGIALSAERHLNRLLERIVDAARSINNADAGTLYTVDPDARVLNFEILQNESLGTRLGGERGDPISLPPVPLDPTNVSAYVALTGQLVNIPDVYEADGFDFSGPRRYDAVTGYRSQSMLVVPMRNHEDEVVGVLQLINARDPKTGQVIAFRPGNVERTRAMASEAGIALTNAQLIEDLEAFLDGLIRVMAAAVDEKSHYTAGHIERVTRLAVLLGERVNECAEGRFAATRLSRDEIRELEIAGLLHDIGKIVVPEHVVDKATKLQTVYDRIAEIRARFSVIRRGLENDALRRKLALAQAGASEAALAAVDAEAAAAVAALGDDLAFLENINAGGEFMAPEKLARLHAIAARRYVDDAGNECPYLSENEVENLSIARGTLLQEEFEIIRNHAKVSARLLSRIPFARKLRNVPLFAGDHHETLNGTGYPAGKTAADLPLQSRILAIADIYDALTSSDRPYKKAYPAAVAHRILREEAARGKLDADLVELFIDADEAGELQQRLEPPEPAARG